MKILNTDWAEVLDQVNREIERCCDEIGILQCLPPDERVTCRICHGTADPQCGCDGTQSAAEAIRELESLIEILCK